MFGASSSACLSHSGLFPRTPLFRALSSSRPGLSRILFQHFQTRLVGTSLGSDRPSSPQVLKAHRHYEGTLFRCAHHSDALGGLEARFSVYVPDSPRAHNHLPYPEGAQEFPVLFFLSGLTCSDENVITKANAQEHCSYHGLIFVAPDTSPRGAGLDGEEERFDFGTGAGYYLDATTDPWRRYYNMAAYINELQALVHAHFPTLGPELVSLMGHSMGGMGALAIALRDPGQYKSISALAPITNPTALPEGSSPDIRLAFKRFLGDDEALWRKYDPVCLVRDYGDDFPLDTIPPLLVDQGAEDEFLKSGVLRPLAFLEACQNKGIPVDYRLRAGFDHSYFHISSVIEEHIEFHAKYLDD